MVVGNGMIAQRFDAYKAKNDMVIFASGVSNSKSIDENEFDRERKLLLNCLEQNPEKHFVYFSTCSIYDPSEQSRPYVLHKKEMENIIQKKAPSFHIFRISNIVGRTDNPHTVFNFYVQQIKAQSSFQLWEQAGRNLIDNDDFYAIASYILDANLFVNEITNIANPESYNVLTIVQAIEQYLQMTAHYSLVQKGSTFDIDTNKITPIIQKLRINFGDHYIKTLLEKYFD